MLSRRPRVLKFIKGKDVPPLALSRCRQQCDESTARNAIVQKAPLQLARNTITEATKTFAYPTKRTQQQPVLALRKRGKEGDNQARHLPTGDPSGHAARASLAAACCRRRKESARTRETTTATTPIFPCRLAVVPRPPTAPNSSPHHTHLNKVSILSVKPAYAMHTPWASVTRCSGRKHVRAALASIWNTRGKERS